MADNYSCNGCGISQPDSAYYRAKPTKGNQRGYRELICKKCFGQVTRANRLRRLSNPIVRPPLKPTATKTCRRCDVRQLYKNFYRSAAGKDGYKSVCKHCILAADRERSTGCSPALFKTLLQQQNGQCATCGETEPGGRGGWHADHCHTTMKVRGLLCSKCNVALGMINDSAEIADNLAAYLRQHAA